MVISGVVVMLDVLANPICQYRLWGKMKNFLSLTVTKVFMVQKYQTLMPRTTGAIRAGGIPSNAKRIVQMHKSWFRKLTQEAIQNFGFLENMFIS